MMLGSMEVLDHIPELLLWFHVNMRKFHLVFVVDPISAYNNRIKIILDWCYRFCSVTVQAKIQFECFGCQVLKVPR